MRCLAVKSFDQGVPALIANLWRTWGAWFGFTALLPKHRKEAVPDKYWSESSSDINVEVKEGANEIPNDVK
jgi:hypothetical protein